MRLLTTAILAAGVTLFGVSAPQIGEAEAGIKCQGRYQVVEGRLLATPYCGDAMLGKVARQAGMNVSDNAMRWDESAKEQACRLVGTDIRISDVCKNYMPDGGRWR